MAAAAARATLPEPVSWPGEVMAQSRTSGLAARAASSCIITASAANAAPKRSGTAQRSSWSQ